MSRVVILVVLMISTRAIAAEDASLAPEGRWTVQLTPVTALWMPAGGRLVAGAVAEVGLHVFRTDRFSVHAGVGLSMVPVVGLLAGAMVGQDWVDERLYAGRLRVNAGYLPRGHLRSGPQTMLGMRWAPSAVFEEPKHHDGLGKLNANALLVEAGVGWRWRYGRDKVAYIMPTLLFGQTRLNVIKSARGLGWERTIGGELTIGLAL